MSDTPWLTTKRGVTNSVDWKKLHALGVTEAMKQNCTVTKPKRAYLDIRGSDDTEREYTS